MVVLDSKAQVLGNRPMLAEFRVLQCKVAQLSGVLQCRARLRPKQSLRKLPAKQLLRELPLKEPLPR